MYFNNIYPSLMKSTNGVTPDIEIEKERKKLQCHLVEQEEGVTHIIQKRPRKSKNI
jgi:hypothetical protein